MKTNNGLKIEQGGLYKTAKGDTIFIDKFFFANSESNIKFEKKTYFQGVFLYGENANLTDKFFFNEQGHCFIKDYWSRKKYVNNPNLDLSEFVMKITGEIFIPKAERLLEEKKQFEIIKKSLAEDFTDIIHINSVFGLMDGTFMLIHTVPSGDLARGHYITDNFIYYNAINLHTRGRWLCNQSGVLFKISESGIEYGYPEHQLASFLLTISGIDLNDAIVVMGCSFFVFYSNIPVSFNRVIILACSMALNSFLPKVSLIAFCLSASLTILPSKRLYLSFSKK